MSEQKKKCDCGASICLLGECICKCHGTFEQNVKVINKALDERNELRRKLKVAMNVLENISKTYWKQNRGLATEMAREALKELKP